MEFKELPDAAKTEEPVHDWRPTNHLRWVASPTPGERRELQQLWSKDNELGDYYREEEWREIETVGWSL